jgi:hypothetical protein
LLNETNNNIQQLSELNDQLKPFQLSVNEYNAISMPFRDLENTYNHLRDNIADEISQQESFNEFLLKSMKKLRELNEEQPIDIKEVEDQKARFYKLRLQLQQFVINQANQVHQHVLPDENKLEAAQQLMNSVEEKIETNHAQILVGILVK